MKIFGFLLSLLVLAGVIVYIDGAQLPYDHTVSVTVIVAAPQDKVFALIANVANGANWRPEVKSVNTLTPDQGRAHWVEHLAHGRYMTFLALNTAAPNHREVQLDEPRAAYGGVWTYELSAGPTSGTTTLQITEKGFIKPPVYRFVMTHVVGSTHFLDQYMKDIQAAAPKQ
ncbi:MAG TPA: SRPBCC family protein [Acidobacteriaceae bacterium]|nr:SRPBCC family protein [Acidobacteriaceae bacterium]